MPSLEVAGTMNNPHIDCQMWPIEGAWNQVIERSLCKGNTFAADVAPPFVAVVDGLNVDRLTSRSAFSRHSPQSLLANLLWVRLVIPFLYFMRCVGVILAPLGRGLAAALFFVWRIPGFLEVLPSGGIFSGMRFTPAAGVITFASKAFIKVIYAPLLLVARMFGPPAAAIGECLFGMHCTPTRPAFTVKFAFLFAMCFNPPSHVFAVVFAILSRVFVGHRYAAFPGTAGSYPTAPVRAA